MRLKTVTIDIETAPNLGYYWDAWSKGNWSAIKTIQPWYILCVGYKWLGKKAQIVALPDFPTYKPHIIDERKALSVIWNVLNEAEVVVGWNSTSFDIKKLNAKFLKYGFGPPSPYKQVDAMRQKTKVARSNSNKLDDTSEEWGTGRKLKHEGFPLWERCMMGDPKAWKKMKRYCVRDVVVTERNYLRIRPWMTNHPKSFSGRACEVCNSQHITFRGTLRTKRQLLKRFQCQGCGTWGTVLDKKL